VVEAMQAIGGEVVITADHGNAELMRDYQNNQPHTQHTTNLVPMIYVGRSARLSQDGALSDLAPTLLTIMGVTQPVEMTGKNLISFTALT
jgi:2,3-bisphosphoglycerate-independent phosphoglycerate mutase